MPAEGDDIARATERRDRFARAMRTAESPEQRLARVVQLQRQTFELLEASPEGHQHYLRRNYKSRRVEVIDGQWRPVSPDRRACLP